MSKHIHKTAQGIAALGRGEDKMLVHMTPREVEGLQKIALASGGSLTINPHTGLVEAGWLSSLLPMIAGGVASVMTGGAALPILLAGMGGGALGAKAEGEDPLMGGVMGAMGGFGGGSLANLAMGAGQAGASAAAQAAAGEAAKGAAASAAGTTAADLAQGAAAMTPGSSMNALGAATQNAIPAAALPQGVTPAAQIAAKQAGADAAAQMGGKEAFMSGIKGLANKGGRDAMVQSWNGLTNSQKMGAAGAGLAGVSALSSMSGGGGGGKGKKPYYYLTEAEYDPNGFVSFSPGTWTKNYPYDGKYSTKMADGGEVNKTTSSVPPAPTTPSTPDMAQLKNYYMSMLQPPAVTPQPPDLSAHNAYMQQLDALVHKPPVVPEKPFQQPVPVTPTTTKKKKRVNPLEQRLTGGVKKAPVMDPANYQYTYDPSTGGFTKMAAGGGIKALAGGGPPGGGRFIEGPGDGTSDDIPATINGDQPAALADGEFVIDARTVAQLGNGSSKAGARALYDMMDRAHALRTKPGQKVNPRKIMPV